MSQLWTTAPGRLSDGADGVTTLLLDADGTLFPSEEPAYEASAVVTNMFLAGLGARDSYTPRELQEMTNGKNFRASAHDFAKQYGVTLDDGDIDTWVAAEKDVVTAHLREVLHPDPAVVEVLETLRMRFLLAAVTSSALSRLDACLEVTGLAASLPPERRFSAEDSLGRPTSKPDPAVYRLAVDSLGVDPAATLAIEDSVNGTLSAVAAGVHTVGTVQFVPPDLKQVRQEELLDAGAFLVVDDLAELLVLLGVE